MKGNFKLIRNIRKMEPNNTSILDEIQLDKYNFEGAIAVGMTKSQIMTMFHTNSRDMDHWCMENYRGLNFDTVFEMVKQCCYKEFLDTVKSLGYRGNPSALNIINNAINEQAANNVVKIVFDNKGIEVETEDDKLADD